MYLNLFRNTKHSPVCSRRDLSGLLYPEYYILFIFIRRRYQGFFRQIFLKTDPTIPQKPRSPEYQKRETFFLFYMVFSVFKRQSEDFFWRWTGHRTKPVRPVCTQGNGARIGLIFREVLPTHLWMRLEVSAYGSIKLQRFQLHFAFIINEMRNLHVRHSFLSSR